MLSVGSHTLHGVIVKLNKPVRNIPHRSNFSVAMTDRVVTVLYLSASLASLGGQVKGVIVNCAFSHMPIAIESLGIRNTLALLVGSTLRPGLIRALCRAPTFIRNKPFTGVTRNYGDMLTAGATLGLTSCIVARTNFKTSLNTRGFVSVGMPRLNGDPSTIIVITAIHSLGVRNNMLIGSLGDNRGIRTIQANFTGLRGRVRGVRRCNIPIIITLGRFAGSATTRVRTIIDLYTTRSISYVRATI